MSTTGCDQAWRFICLPMGKKKKMTKRSTQTGRRRIRLIWTWVISCVGESHANQYRLVGGYYGETCRLTFTFSQEKQLHLCVSKPYPSVRITRGFLCTLFCFSLPEQGERRSSDDGIQSLPFKAFTFDALWSRLCTRDLQANPGVVWTQCLISAGFSG